MKLRQLIMLLLTGSLSLYAALNAMALPPVECQHPLISIEVSRSEFRSKNVEFVGQIGGAMQAVALQGNYAYVGIGPRLVILDISDPRCPIMVGQTDVFTGVVQDVAVTGNYAYVAAYWGGLYIVDVSDVANPDEVVRYVLDDWMARPLLVEVAGNYAYIITYKGLHVLDVSDPTHVSQIGFFEASWDYAYELALAANYLCIAAGPDGLRIIDVSHPAHPIEIGFDESPQWATGVAVLGTPTGKYYAYVTDRNTLHTIYVSDPAHPQWIGSETMTGSIEAPRVALSAGHLCVTSLCERIAPDRIATAPLNVFDLSVPEHPSWVSYYDVPRGSTNIAMSGNLAFVTGGDNSLRILDIGQPAPFPPIQIGSYAFAGGGYGLGVSHGHAYVAAQQGGLYVVDVSMPVLPQKVGAYLDPGRVDNVMLSGRYAYITGFVGGLRTLDISNPVSPTFVSSYGAGNAVAVSDNLAFVGVWGGLHILDVSDPKHPALVGSCSTGASAVDVAVSGQCAYLAGGEDGGLRIISVADPVHPREIASQPAGNARRVTVWNNIAYVASGEWGLYVIDISDPIHPAEIARYYPPGHGEVRDVVVDGRYAYLANGTGPWGGFSIQDISDPAHPVEVGFHDTPGYGEGIAVDGEFAYLADREGGLLILRMLHDKIITVVSPDGGNLTSSAGDTSFIFPSGAFTATANVTYRHLWTDRNTGILAGIGRIFDLSAVYSDTGQVTQLAPGQSFTVTLHYTDRELGSVREDTLALYAWDGSAWVREPTSVLDAGANTISATPNHLGLFAVLGETHRLYLPVVMKRYGAH